MHRDLPISLLPPAPPAPAERAAQALAGLPPGQADASALKALVELATRYDGSAGGTAGRFGWLSAVCAQDVVLGKLFESHLDAWAILRELLGTGGATALAAQVGATDGLWGVWAAGGPGRLRVQPASDVPFIATGRKSWCSGASGVAAALVTAEELQPDGATTTRLFAVPLGHPGVTVTSEGWAAIGMQGTGSVDVEFHGVPAWPVGAAGDYLTRPGFWHGAAGIAACWHGAARAIAAPLRDRVRGEQDKAQDTGAEADGLLAAHLGAVDGALSASAALLREAAGAIDRHRAGGRAFGRREALAVRAAAEAAAQAVMEHTGRALGAGPLCRDARHAARVADLGVFLRQSHAEWDLAALGRLVATQDTTEKDDPWML